MIARCSSRPPARGAAYTSSTATTTCSSSSSFPACLQVPASSGIFLSLTPRSFLSSHHTLPANPGPIYCSRCSSSTCSSGPHRLFGYISHSWLGFSPLHSPCSLPASPRPSPRHFATILYAFQAQTGRGGRVDMPLSFRLTSIHHQY